MSATREGYFSAATSKASQMLHSRIKRVLRLKSKSSFSSSAWSRIGGDHIGFWGASSASAVCAQIAVELSISSSEKLRKIIVVYGIAMFVERLLNGL